MLTRLSDNILKLDHQEAGLINLFVYEQTRSP